MLFRSTTELEEIFSKFQPEIVVHLAAQAGVRLNAADYTSSNLDGFFSLWTLSLKHQVQSFVFASSSSVYGDYASLPFKETENKLVPSSYYGFTKLLNEKFVESMVRGSDIRARALRFFTVYGPWGRPDMAYFRLLDAAINSNKFTLYGDGKIERDFTYIDDVAIVASNLIEQVADMPGGNFDYVNIGGEAPVSIEKIVQEIQKQTGKSIEISKVARNPMDAQRTMASRDYATKLVGSHNYLSIETGISRLVEWGERANTSSKLTEWVSSVQGMSFPGRT